VVANVREIPQLWLVRAFEILPNVGSLPRCTESVKALGRLSGPGRVCLDAYLLFGTDMICLRSRRDKPTAKDR
jgi:hypothetical protein